MKKFMLSSALLALFLLFTFPIFSAGPPPGRVAAALPQISLDQVATAAREGKIDSITISGDTLTIKMTDGRLVQAIAEPNTTPTTMLRNLGVTSQQLSAISLQVVPPPDYGGLFTILLIVAPFGVLFLILIMLSRRSRQSAPDQTFSFGKSKAKIITGQRPDVTFDDVAGEDEAKQELQEVVEFLQTPGKFAALGARIPKGLLLVGPPGTGKTLLARAVAGEAGAPFFSMSGSEFVEVFVGVGASRVRDLFDQAKKAAPAIVFIDEIDAVGRHRGSGVGGGNDEREQTLNQILVEMDGFDQGTNIVVIAATNRPDILDQALLRPGRFDRRVTLDPPDTSGRVDILKVHSKGKPLAPDVDLDVVARQTPGFTGADLANLMNEAAILVARRGGKQIGIKEIEEAIERVIAGPERKSRIMSPKEKLITAYHEGGHALVAYMLPNADPVHKITIVSRGMSGGHTRLLPSEDRHLYTKSQLKDTLAFALGGLASEELVFGQTTTGPGNDLQQATKMAGAMVCEYGMSEALGAIVCVRRDEEGSVGSQYGERLANLIDAETHQLLSEALQRAKTVLTENRGILDKIAQRLMMRESIRGEELVEIVGQPKAEPQLV